MFSKECDMFENLKVGDAVVVKTTQRQCIRIEHVARITKTRIILTDGDQYRMSDGWRFGSCGTDRYFDYRLGIDPIDFKRIELNKATKNIVAFANLLSNSSFAVDDVLNHLAAATEVNKIIEDLKKRY